MTPLERAAQLIKMRRDCLERLARDQSRVDLSDRSVGLSEALEIIATVPDPAAVIDLVPSRRRRRNVSEVLEVLTPASLAVPPAEMLTTREVAAMFRVTERTIINWAAEKRLRSTRTLGGHLRFARADIERLRVEVSVKRS